MRCWVCHTTRHLFLEDLGSVEGVTGMVVVSTLYVLYGYSYKVLDKEKALLIGWMACFESERWTFECLVWLFGVARGYSIGCCGHISL